MTPLESLIRLMAAEKNPHALIVRVAADKRLLDAAAGAYEAVTTPGVREFMRAAVLRESVRSTAQGAAKPVQRDSVSADPVKAGKAAAGDPKPPREPAAASPREPLKAGAGEGTKAGGRSGMDEDILRLCRAHQMPIDVFIERLQIVVHLLNLGGPEQDYYDILGIDRTADPAEVKQAFRRLSLQYHPDRNPDDPEAAEHFRSVHRAYEVLRDDKLRERYNLRLVKPSFVEPVPGSGKDVPGDPPSTFSKVGRRLRRSWQFVALVGVLVVLAFMVDYQSILTRRHYSAKHAVKTADTGSTRGSTSPAPGPQRSEPPRTYTGPLEWPSKVFDGTDIVCAIVAGRLDAKSWTEFTGDGPVSLARRPKERIVVAALVPNRSNGNGRPAAQTRDDSTAPPAEMKPVEAPKAVETPKAVEPTKAEPAKIEPQPVQIAAKPVEPPRVEPVTREAVEPAPAPPRAEPVKVEPVKVEPPKAEPKPVQVAAKLPEPPKAEPKPAEPLKPEPKAKEPPKSEEKAAKAPVVDEKPAKAEPKPSKAESRPAEPVKVEPVKVEPPKAEPKPVQVAAKPAEPPKVEPKPQEAVKPPPREATPPPAPEPPSVPDSEEIARRVNAFVDRYVRAYESRSTPTVMTFFEPGAVENGRPVANLRDVYDENFRKAASLRYRIRVKNAVADRDGIRADCRFNLSVRFEGQDPVNSQGRLTLQLVSRGGELKIRRLEYGFE